MRQILVLMGVFVVVASCSGCTPTTTTTTSTSTSTTTTTTSTTTSTTTTTTTTTLPTGPTVTTLPEGFRSPINGLHPELETLLDRRGLAVKVDNHPEARPKSGIQNADGMIEILVEGGFTRLIAVFHDNDATTSGRSAPSDPPTPP
jgi:hypothetical protein